VASTAARSRWLLFLSLRSSTDVGQQLGGELPTVRPATSRGRIAARNASD
jgi:hypothetical protein